MSSFKPAARRVVSGGSKAATADRNNNNNNNAATASSAAAPGSTSAPQNGSVISYGQEFGPGVKAGAGGSVLSIGLNDLDRLFGGGVPLGSLIILYEVRHCALSWPSNFQRLMSKTIVMFAADPASTEVVFPRQCTASPSHSACRCSVLWPPEAVDCHCQWREQTPYLHQCPSICFQHSQMLAGRMGRARCHAAQVLHGRRPCLQATAPALARRRQTPRSVRCSAKAVASGWGEQQCRQSCKCCSSSA